MARQSGLGREARLRRGRAQGDQRPFDCISGGTAGGLGTAGRALRHQRRHRPARRRLQGRQHGRPTKPRPIMQAQIAAFVEGGADMVTAYTLNSINEAIGIARAARAQRIPAAISFTVETNGRLVKGETLREAIETVDRETRRCAGIFPDQLRPSDAFRGCVEGGRSLDGAYPWRQGQRLDEEPRRTRRIRNARCGRSGRSRAALPQSQGRVSEDAHSRRLLRHRSPARAKAICEACVPAAALSA